MNVDGQDVAVVLVNECKERKKSAAQRVFQKSDRRTGDVGKESVGKEKGRKDQIALATEKGRGEAMVVWGKNGQTGNTGGHNASLSLIHTPILWGRGRNFPPYAPKIDQTSNFPLN
jgi:hypothetical protein